MTARRPFIIVKEYEPSPSGDAAQAEFRAMLRRWRKSISHTEAVSILKIGLKEDLADVWPAGPINRPQSGGGGEAA